ALQATALETTLMNKQVDAISVFATSNMPSLLVQGVKFRFYNFADVGIRLYSNCLTTSPTYLKENKSVVEAWADGMNEGLKYSVTNFEGAVDIFVNEVPEVKMSSTGKAHTRYGAGSSSPLTSRPSSASTGLAGAVQTHSKSRRTW